MVAQRERAPAGDCIRGKKYDLKSTVPIKIEYEIRRRTTKIREIAAFPYILAGVSVGGGAVAAFTAVSFFFFFF